MLMCSANLPPCCSFETLSWACVVLNLQSHKGSKRFLRRAWFWFQGQQVPKNRENMSVAPWCCKHKVALNLKQEIFYFHCLRKSIHPMDLLMTTCTDHPAHTAKNKHHLFVHTTSTPWLGKIELLPHTPKVPGSILHYCVHVSYVLSMSV